MHFGENIESRLHREVAFQQSPSEPLSGDFDFFGERDFLRPRQQGDFAHLCEVDPHGIVDSARSVVTRQFAVRLRPSAPFLFRLAVRRLLVRDDVHLHFLDPHQQIVELFRVAGFVRKIVVDLRISQVALLFPLIDQLAQRFVNSMH